MAPGLILPEDGAVGFEACPAEVLRWCRQQTSRGAAQDLDWAMDRLHEFRAHAAAGEHHADVLRVYVPEPTVAFGQRDTRLPGYERAVDAVRAQGFTPVTRRAGGRAAAYHHGCVVVDHLALEPDAAIAQQQRFAQFADLFVDAFARMDVPASVGQIPGEYCPGEFSVQGAAPQFPVKLAGSAQRVVKGAWLFSTHVVVQDALPLRAVLTDVYQALEMPMDPRTVGAADQVRAGAEVETFIEALHGAYTAWAMERGRVLVEEHV
ncbi:lipoyl protein ligase domain-containing protein [uncultured Micrococcus sp.]|uniref:lipoate--protein ligase family protein n=1 Tax=uncultured Micrococcus sp. TaxID=114051 RepID=UPI00259ACBD3|nr:lipoate--protein ligase family protein [uncultured Micrococcus sp.]